MAKNLIKNKKTKKNKTRKWENYLLKYKKNENKNKKGTTTNDSQIDVFENSKIC